MSDQDPLPTPPNLAVELAKARNRAAEERTLMAWIRTSLSLISFGVGIDRIVALIDQGLGGAVNEFRLSRVLGLAFVALGTVALILATLDHRYQLHRIQRDELIYVSRRSPSLFVAVVLAALGSMAFMAMLISPWLA